MVAGTSIYFIWMGYGRCRRAYDELLFHVTSGDGKYGRFTTTADVQYGSGTNCVYQYPRHYKYRSNNIGWCRGRGGFQFGRMEWSKCDTVSGGWHHYSQ